MNRYLDEALSDINYTDIENLKDFLYNDENRYARTGGQKYKIDHLRKTRAAKNDNLDGFEKNIQNDEEEIRLKFSSIFKPICHTIYEGKNNLRK